MAQEIEIECKVLLSKHEYHRLLHEMPFPAKSITQTNHYFETSDFLLKEHRSALRIREKGDSYTLTLKEPHKDGILETHDILSKEEFLSWINGQPIAKEHTSKQLTQIGIKMESLIYYGSLQTERRSFVQDRIEYVLDKSMYNNTVDYEFELEAPSISIASTAFQKILQTHSILTKEPITKIERFFKTLR